MFPIVSSFITHWAEALCENLSALLLHPYQLINGLDYLTISKQEHLYQAAAVTQVSDTCRSLQVTAAENPRVSQCFWALVKYTMTQWIMWCTDLMLGPTNAHNFAAMLQLTPDL